MLHTFCFPTGSSHPSRPSFEKIQAIPRRLVAARVSADLTGLCLIHARVDDGVNTGLIMNFLGWSRKALINPMLNSLSQFILEMLVVSLVCLQCNQCRDPTSHLQNGHLMIFIQYIYIILYIYAWMNLDVQQAFEEESDFGPVASDHPKTVYS